MFKVLVTCTVVIGVFDSMTKVVEQHIYDSEVEAINCYYKLIAKIIRTHHTELSVELWDVADDCLVDFWLM